MWSCYLFDAVTGLLAQPIDIPSVSWTLTVANCALATEQDKDVGADDAGSLTLPWSAVPGATNAAKHGAILPHRRGLVLMWDGIPVIAGIIGDRTDSWLDTDFSLLSIMDVLASRYIVPEGTFGRGTVRVKSTDYGQEAEGGEASVKIGSVTTSTVRYDKRSYRAIACDLVRLATEAKPGGALPLVLPYLGESGTRSREYYGYNVSNNDCAKLLNELANVEKGPDIQFRPEFKDATHVQWRLIAGSDSEPRFTGLSPVPTLTCFPGGGTAQNLKVAHSGPVMRVYETGSGTDRATLCYLAEDLTLCNRLDPWPLMETNKSNTDDDSASLVKTHALAELADVSAPLAQITCEVNAMDPYNPVKPGYVWPGEPVDLYVEGHPSIPDGTYSLRLMEMGGDLGATVTLTFDIMEDPMEAM